MEKILVVAPHSDDEVLGCGGYIKKLVNAGKEVFVLIMTNAHIGDPDKYPEERVRKVREEAFAAHQYLGIKETFFMDFPAPRLDTFP